MNAKIKNHKMYTKSDYEYFKNKGYTDEEIIAFWNRDLARDCEPLRHRPAPDMVGYLNQPFSKK